MTTPPPRFKAGAGLAAPGVGRCEPLRGEPGGGAAPCVGPRRCWTRQPLSGTPRTQDLVHRPGNEGPQTSPWRCHASARFSRKHLPCANLAVGISQYQWRSWEHASAKPQAWHPESPPTSGAGYLGARTFFPSLRPLREVFCFYFFFPPSLAAWTSSVTNLPPRTLKTFFRPALMRIRWAR